MPNKKLQVNSTSHSTHSPPPRALLVAFKLPDISDAETQASLTELEQLATGIGIEVVGSVSQRRPTLGLLGEGKLAEIDALISAPESDDAEFQPEPSTEHARQPLADLVIVDAELRPGDAHQLEARLGVEVMDRTGVILKVFEQRAQTREARLEIDLARLLYDAPRVRSDDSNEGRVGGGDRGGRGHTNVELTKQALRERTAQLRRELLALQRANATRRARRSETPVAALVGYTNAGKSSWMRALSGSSVLVEDQLFATVGTTVRALEPKTSPRILVSDTVGFIRNLPHALIASFKATLDEARDAGLLLMIADASDPELRAHLTVTREVLAEIGAADIPSLLVLNKVDRVEAELAVELQQEFPEALLLSAHRAQDVAQLRAAIVEFFERQMLERELLVPYAKLRIVPEIHELARVMNESYSDEGARLHVRATQETLARLERQLE